jgi:integrase
MAQPKRPDTRKPRREKGTGAVYFDETHGNGRWYGQVTIDGKRHRVYGKDGTDVKAKLRKLTAKRDTGTAIENQTITVKESVDVFMERGLPNRTSHGRPLAPSTLDTYQWSADHITAEIGSMKLAALHVTDVEAMLDRLAARPMSAGSLRKLVGVLVRVIDFAERRDEVNRNVARNATLPPTAAPEVKRKSLQPDEARTLLEALKHERNGLMFAVSLRMALRPGEAAALYWDAWDGSTLNVTRGVRRTNGRVEVTDEVKVESARRTIQVPDELLEWFDQHRADQVAERLAAGSWFDDRLMFASPTGHVLSPSNNRKHLTAICADVGVTRVTPNELRHTSASLLSDEGVPNELIADLLGHTSTKMVDQTYRHRLRPVVDVAAKTDWTSQTS